MRGRLPLQKRARKARLLQFLELYASTGNITRSCFESKLNRSTIYDLMERDADFQVAFKSAEDTATDALIQEARRRAHDGIDEPTGWYKGKPGGVVRRYSDNLLMFLIKERRPEFRDKFEVTGAGGQPLQIVVAAYGAQEVPKKGYKETAVEPKEPKDPDPDLGPGAPPIEVEAKGV